MGAQQVAEQALEGRAPIGAAAAAPPSASAPLQPPPLAATAPPPPSKPPPLPVAVPEDAVDGLDTAAIRFGAPQHLAVAVTHAERGRDGKPSYTIVLALDGVEWSVHRKERDLAELHTELGRLMRFLPDPPLSQRHWLWRGAEQLGTLQHRLQAYLTELTCNGQWVWDESAVLRHFLQIPVTSQNRQAREVLMRDIRSFKVQRERTQMLAEIKSGKAKQGLARERTTSRGPQLLKRISSSNHA